MTKLFTSSPCQKFSLCLASLLTLAIAPKCLRADMVNTEEWQIEADKVTRFDRPKSVIAEGHVVLTKLRKLPPGTAAPKQKTTKWTRLLEESPAEGTEAVVTQEITKETKPHYITEVTIRADWIAYDMEQNSIKAKGNVAIKSNTDELLANEGVFDLTNETGTFKEATILRDALDLHLEGKTIQKTGFNTYQIEDGWVVTCKVEKDIAPPWSFASKDTKITQGGYAVLKHATFRIKDVPVLYTPWIMLPVGDKRHTGLLFPEISNSDNNGFGLNLPLFVNISDSTDITLYPEYYANRGVMPGLEYRYILGSQKKGTFMANYLQDDLSDPSETDYREDTGYTHTNEDRYWLRGKADHDFDNDISTRVDLDIVSDRDYLTEFNSGITGFTQSNERFFEMYGRGFENKTDDQRNNSMKILKSWNGMSLEGNLLAINDIRTDSTSPTPLWKLPSLDFTGSQAMGETTLTFDWDTNYVNYYREDGVGGHRFDIYPRLSMPLPLGPYLESRADAGLRDTFYKVQTYGDGTWDQNDTPNRFLGDFHTEIGTTLLRNFDLALGEATGIGHHFRPYIEYDYLSETDQEDLPDFDSVDLIEDINAITYGVDNFFNLFGKRGGSDTERDYGYLKVEQSYDLRSVSSDNPLTPVDIELGWNPLTNFNLIYKTEIDVYGEGVTLYGLESYYRNSRGDYLNFDYRYNREDTIHQLNVSARAQLFDTIFAKYAIEHSLSESTVIEQNISLLYQPACWSVELKSQYTPGDHNIMLVFNLANIGSPLGLGL
ncbi:MAG: LPS assembly protein LptD [Proteobacteria bacterium]|nr:LPS assembly protein LptD [Pseudomonadota bacterium]